MTRSVLGDREVDDADELADRLCALHEVALELCAWMSLRAVSNDPTP